MHITQVGIARIGRGTPDFAHDKTHCTASQECLSHSQHGDMVAFCVGLKQVDSLDPRSLAIVANRRELELLFRLGAECASSVGSQVRNERVLA